MAVNLKPTLKDIKQTNRVLDIKHKSVFDEFPAI